MSFGGNDVIKFRINGYGPDNTSWSTSFSLIVNRHAATPMTQAHLVAILAQVNTPVGTLNTTLASRIWSADTTITLLDAYYYPSGSGTSTLVAHTTAGGVLGSVTVYQPILEAIVATLRTETPTRSGRGRMYLPCNALALPSDHQFPQATCTDICNAVKTLFQSVNGLNMTANGVDSQQVCVASSTKAATYIVDEISVDSKPDVQHRRQDKAAALRAFNALV